MFGDWPLEGAAPLFEAPGYFDSNDLSDIDLNGNLLPDFAGKSSDSQGHTASPSGDEIAPPAPPGIAAQCDTYLPSAFDQFTQDQHPFGSPSGSSQLLAPRDNATGAGALEFSEQAVLFDRHYKTTGIIASPIGDLAVLSSILTANDNVVFDHSYSYAHANAHANAQQQLQTSDVQVKFGGSSAQTRVSQFDDIPAIDFDAVLGQGEVRQDGVGGSQQFQREEDSAQSPDITATDVPPQADSQTSEPTNEQHPRSKPCKSRAKKATGTKQTFAATKETLDLKIPSADYNFAVTDEDDVFLDPKPEGDFGKHDPHLAKKVSVATKELKEQEGHASQVTHIPGHQQVLWSPPRNDYSVPSTPEHYTICFDLLVKAISYIGEEVSEKRDTTEFKTRWIKRTHYDQDFVQVLAKQVLDTLIQVHTHGWTYYVQDPAFRDFYYKTKYFTFRDRFNLTALVLKHSKTTCNDLLKGQRLYDVIGNSYHLETRVTSNKKANADRAVRLAKGKEQEEAEKIAPGTKRARSADDNEEPSNESVVSKKPSKRQKVNGGIRHSVDAPNAGPPVKSTTGAPVEAMLNANLPSDTTAASSTGPASVMKAPCKNKEATDTSSSTSTEQRRSKVVVLKVGVDPIAFHNFSDTEASDSNIGMVRSTKRAFEEVDDDAEPPASSAKKSKTSSHTKAPMKGKGKANSAAAIYLSQDDAETKYMEKPLTRREGANESASGSQTKRTSSRLHKSAAGSSAVSAPPPPRLLPSMIFPRLSRSTSCSQEPLDRRLLQLP